MYIYKLTQKAAAEISSSGLKGTSEYISKMLGQSTDNEPRPLSSYTQMLKAKYIFEHKTRKSL